LPLSEAHRDELTARLSASCIKTLHMAEATQFHRLWTDPGGPDRDRHEQRSPAWRCVRIASGKRRNCAKRQDIDEGRTR
jgi:hypothetical protein